MTNSIPRFDYEPLQTTEQFGLRWYFDPRLTEPKFYPSITTVLSQTMSPEKKKILDDWRARVGDEQADAVCKHSTDRGSAMHAALESLMGGERVDLDSLLPAARMLFNALKPHVKNVSEVWGIEAALRSDKVDVAGRCDLIGVFEGVPSIVDYKTANWPKKREDIEDYFIQTAFYAKAHNEKFGTDIKQGVILIGVERGLPQKFKVELKDFEEALLRRVEAFYVAFNIGVLAVA